MIFIWCFMERGLAVLTVNADSSGCQPVNLVGLGLRKATDGFWQASADALGIDEDTLWTLLSPSHSLGAMSEKVRAGLRLKLR